MTDIVTLPRPQTGEPIRASHARALQEAVKRLGASNGRQGRARLTTHSLSVGIIQSLIFSPPVHALRIAAGTSTIDAVVPWTFSEAAREGVSYTYTSINEREASFSDGSETQVLTPKYLTGDAVAIFFDGLVWRDLNIDGRQWAAVENA